MAKITFIILAHENAGQLADFARLLTGWKEDVHAVIHYDLNSPDAQFRKLKAEFATSDRVHLVKDRVRCGWGDFSLVEGVLRALRLIRDRKIDCERVMLVSGACMPIRPLAELSDFLDAHPHQEFIETYDSNWIVGGLREQRYLYHHPVNHRKYYNTFRYIYLLQKTLKLKRSMPQGLVPKFGSQWWTLTWDLCAQILGFLERNPDVYRFFRTTWIPDEMFFQTLAYHLVPAENLAGHNLTFYQFNDWGMPLVFSDSHMTLLETIPRYFARKIGGGAVGLKKRLREIAVSHPEPGEALPVLPPKWRFPAREIAKRNAELKPGFSRLFAHDGTQTLSESLLEYDRSFVVLYGPPEVVYRTIERIKHMTGYTVLGRIFNPHWVDLGNGHDNFHGLNTTDVKVRDEYPVNYLRRIFLRCEGIPVFTLSPGDNPDIELQLFQSRKSAIFTLAPRTSGQMWQDLYWLLCGYNLPERPYDDTRFLDAYSSRPDSLVATDSQIKEVLNEMLLARDPPISQTRLETYFHYEHGEAAEAIMHLYQIASSAAMSVDFQRTMSFLPQGWRDRFRLLENGQPIWRLVPDIKLKHAEFVTTMPWNDELAVPTHPDARNAGPRPKSGKTR